MKKLIVLLVTLLTLLLGVPQTARSAGNVYYVSPSGNDANPGTSTLPWQTIQKAANTLAPGETAIVLAGNYATERVQVARPGTVGLPITFQAQGTVTMRGFDIAASYINVLGFEIINPLDDMTKGVGIQISSGTYNDIENNYVHDAAWGGIILASATSNNIVRNNRLYHNGQWGVQVSGQNHLIESNEVWGTLQHFPGVMNPPSWVDADGMRFFGSGHTFRKNYIHDITYDPVYNINPHIDCWQTWGDANHVVASNVVFEQNFCKVPVMLTRLAQGSAFTLQGNRNTNTPVSNIVIRNNILIAMGGAYTQVADKIQVVNNTIVGRLNPGDVRCLGVALYTSSHALVKNNIFYNVGQGYTTTPYIDADSASKSTLDAGYNDVYMNDGSTPPGSPYPHDLWKIDPLMVNPSGDDYHLQVGSPPIDAGYNLSPLVTNDFDGNPRPRGAAFDIGALGTE